MAKILIAASMHPVDDKRVFHKVATALSGAGHSVTIRGVAALEPAVQAARRDMLQTVRGGGRFRRLGRLVPVIAKGHYDVVIVPELDSWAAAVITVGLLRGLGKPTPLIVFDCHEHYPSRVFEPVARDHPILGVVAAAALDSLMRRLSVRTDAIITAAAALGDDLLVRGVANVVVANASDAGDTPVGEQPRDVLDLVAQRRMDVRRLAHIGVLTEGRGKSLLIEAARHIRVPLDVEIYGGFDEPVPNVISIGDVRLLSTPWLPRAWALHLASGADATFVGFSATSYNNTMGGAHKLFDSIALGVPVVYPGFRGFRAAMTHAKGIGVPYAPDDARALAAAIEQAVQQAADSQRGALTWESEQETLVTLVGGLVADGEQP